MSVDAANTTALHRDQVRAGALIRRQFRASLDVLGVQWREHKGWLDSVFVITATAAEWDRINSWIRWSNEVVS